MKKVLSLKHWQLFILVFILGSWVSPSPYKEIVNSISFITLIIWIYAIGIFGQKKLEENKLPSMKTNFFLINLAFVSLFFVVSYFFKPEENSTDFSLIDIIFIPISIYAIFAIGQILAFISKTITTLELKKEVKVSDYISNVFLIVFFFIGIWILQPKLKKLIYDN